ncbi:MAG TPA: hypothetical protein PL051_01190 [Candidatus Saccharibacteria bacterium]|nr:hypothetical protein [Candidatus Saccharibacteria bacterium]
MLVAYDRFIGSPVMSLQTGSELARTIRALIDPRDLTVLAYELEGPMLTEHPSFLRVLDVREFSNIGIIVDSSDEFVGLDDVIKLKEVYNFHFDLIGLKVVDKRGRKLGKVTGYTVDSDSFVLQQLRVQRPLLQSFNETELLINRSQIVELSDQQVVVEDGSHVMPDREPVRNYTNPFRQSSAQPEAITPPHE